MPEPGVHGVSGVLDAYSDYQADMAGTGTAPGHRNGLRAVEPGGS